MLRYVGLEANPVLVSTRKNGVFFFPTLKGFNYVIASVILPNKIKDRCKGFDNFEIFRILLYGIIQAPHLSR